MSLLAEAHALLVPDLIISLSGTVACNNRLRFLTWIVLPISTTTCWVLVRFKEQDTGVVTSICFFPTDIYISFSVYSACINSEICINRLYAQREDLWLCSLRFGVTQRIFMSWLRQEYVCLFFFFFGKEHPILIFK